MEGQDLLAFFRKEFFAKENFANGHIAGREKHLFCFTNSPN